MNDDANVFAVSALVALSFGLLLVYLVGSTNVWIAGLVLLALPFIAFGMTLMIVRIIQGRRLPVEETIGESPGESRRSSVEPASRQFIQEWLSKGRHLRDSLPTASVCSIDSDCPAGHMCVDGRCVAQY